MFVLSGRRKGLIRRNRAYISMSLLALISDVQRFINSVGIPFHTLFSRPHLSFAREQRVRRADCKMIYSVFQLCYLNAFEPITFGKCDCSLLYYAVVFALLAIVCQYLRMDFRRGRGLTSKRRIWIQATQHQLLFRTSFWRRVFLFSLPLRLKKFIEKTVSIVMCMFVLWLNV